ncbi:MAG: ABC transporter permease [Deltaproteobacteria bacterium]|nr:ABC transporter permease [Deltaproteobacteria bacterium]
MFKLVYFLRAALSGLRQSPFVHFVAALAIGVAIFAVALSRFGVEAVGAVLEGWGSEVQATVYLKDGLSPEECLELAHRIQREDGGAVRLVGPEEALLRLRQDLGEAGDVLTNLPKNPLPATLEVHPAQGQRSASAIAALAQKWRGYPGVATVEYGREWIERLEGLGRAARGAGALLLLVVLGAAIIVVAATLQLAIHARREEIEIQKLVGATDTFVKAPFLLEGLLQGMLGAGLACLGLWALARYLGPHVNRAAAFAISGISFPPLVGWRSALELCGAGMAVGLIGSLLAVRRFLRV